MPETPHQSIHDNVEDSEESDFEFDEEYSETDRFLILPPDIPPKLRGRPKKLRRREQWEGGSRSRSTQQPTQGQSSNLKRFSSRRIMHCSTCKKIGHRKNKCPGKQDGGQQEAQNSEQEDGTNGGQQDKTDEHEVPTNSQARKHVKVQRPKLQVRRNKHGVLLKSPSKEAAIHLDADDDPAFK
ncbi:hypothetical protein POM88_020104 [Heracleum sosnowskyi]|uniref:CCHC-type domain-containing protein n=1 Tax=Heracleum sosnowskyi TaxID=360622 RepID=A0AAD8MRN3_9APIA|nr:hypothetical protein POM88_020104 [Heracleum sosnowskyi]